MKSHFYSLIVLFVLAVVPASNVFSQGSIGVNTDTPHESASLEVFGTNKGFLLPRISLSNTSTASPVNNPADGLMVYNIANVNDVTPGYYYWDDSKWTRLISGAKNQYENGLTETAGTVRLGGALTQATEIMQSGYNINFTGLGNVGIGTTTISSGAKLDVAGLTFSNGYRTRASNTDYHQFSRSGGGAAVYINQTDGSNPILRLSSGTATANVNVVATFENNGNVGLGLGGSTPTARLHVNGTVRFQSITNGYVKADPSGNLSSAATIPFTDITGAPTYDDSKWTQSGSLLYPKSTAWNVGVGTTSPSSKLDVVGGSIRVPATVYEGAGQIQSSGTVRVANGSAAQGLYVKQLSASNTWADNDTYTQANGIYSSGNLRAGGATVALFANTTSGNVGVGTVSPVSKLEVLGGDLNVSGQGRFKGWFTQGAGLAAEIGISSNQAYILSYDRTASAYQPINIGGSTVALGRNGATDIFINASNNVGIGATDPSTKLDVNGTVRIRGGSPDAGKVLMASSTNGTASWQDPAKAIVAYAGNITSIGWYRIAEINNGGANPGDRGNAEFTLRDFISGGGHSTVNFRMGISYNDRTNMNFTLMNHNYYNTPTFTQIRVLSNTTYAVQYLEVYVNRTGNVNFSIFDNIQTSSWKPITWTAGSVPSGYTNNTYELNKLFNVAGSTEHFTVARDGNVGIGNSSPTYKLHVNGRLKTNGVNETSDERLKTNIKPLHNATEIVNQLQGVTYLWNKEKFPEMNFSGNKQYGLLAQQVEKILPDIVDTDNEGYKSVQYTQLIAVLIEALKEQNNSYNNLSSDFQKLKADVETLKAANPYINSPLGFSEEKK